MKGRPASLQLRTGLDERTLTATHRDGGVKRFIPPKRASGACPTRSKTARGPSIYIPPASQP